MKVRMGNVFSAVEAASEMELEILKEELTVSVPGARWTKAFQEGRWDGTYSFFREKSQTFLTGLLSFVKQKIPLVVVDVRRRPQGAALRPAQLKGVELRDYQRQAIEQALRLERCVLQAPTGSGKTIIGAALLASLPYRAIWLTHRLDLAFQSRDVLSKTLGEEIGLIQADIFEVHRVTVATIQTLYERVKTLPEARKLLRSADVLVIDEAHNVSMNRWRRLGMWSDAYYRYGLTATPLLRHDLQNFWLIGLTGEVVPVVSTTELIDRKLLARPRVMMISNIVPALGEYFLSRVLALEQNKKRNRLVVSLLKLGIKKNLKVLCLVNTIAHGASLVSLLSEEDKEKVWFLTGETSRDERLKTLWEFRCGRLQGIIATPIFDEGIDVPDCRMIILAAGGKSHLRLVQRIGRGMRPKLDDDNTLLVYDFFDVGDPYLEKHSRARLRVYQKERFEIQRIDIDAFLKSLLDNREKGVSNETRRF